MTKGDLGISVRLHLNVSAGSGSALGPGDQLRSPEASAEKKPIRHLKQRIEHPEEEIGGRARLRAWGVRGVLSPKNQFGLSPAISSEKPPSRGIGMAGGATGVIVPNHPGISLGVPGG